MERVVEYSNNEAVKDSLQASCKYKPKSSVLIHLLLCIEAHNLKTRMTCYILIIYRNRVGPLRKYPLFKK